MSEATNKIKVRIQQLLAKAKGTDNEHEAEAFLAKAMDMMREFQLDIADLVDADDPILKHIGLTQASCGHAWRWKLYSKVAQLYGCKTIHVEKMVPGKDGRLVPGYEQTLVGRESAIITTDLMYPWIVSQVKSKAKEIAAKTGMSEQGQAKRVAAALIARISRMLADQRAKDEAPTTEAGRNALVVMNAVDAAYQQHFPNTELIRSRGAKTDSLSRDAANSIGLHRQTSGRDTLRLA